MRSAGTIAAALLVVLGSASGARAADEAAVLLRQAEGLAVQGRCAEATPLVRRARALEPQSARAALLEGECALHEQRYADAIEPLRAARTLDPTLSQVALNLGIAWFQQGDLDAASLELEQAVALMPDSSEAHLYYGLVLLERAETAEAAARFERARTLDPASADPAASYFAGLAFAIAKDREQADAAFERAVAADRNSVWAVEAGRALESRNARVRRRGGWARLTAGMEYDDNVALRGTGVLLPTEISDEKDGRGFWLARSGVELFRDAKWALGILGGYYGNAHLDLQDFDTHFPNASFYVDRALSESTFLRVQPDIGYGWVNYDDYLFTTAVTPSLHHAWGAAGVGRLFFRFEYRDYRFSAFLPASNRDGRKYAGGYDHSYMLTDETQLRGSVGVGHYDSDNGEYTYVGPVVRVGARQDLPFDAALDADFLYRHDHYENRSFFSIKNQRRDDNVFLLRAVLEKRLTENVKLGARYLYENNDSNVGVFDYDRNIIGGFIELEYGPR